MKRKQIFAVLFFAALHALCAINTFAQQKVEERRDVSPPDDTTVPPPLEAEKKDIVFTSVEQIPQFPGGEKALFLYISKSLYYPKMARENEVQGKVFVEFIIEKDGSISNIKVLRGIGSGCNEEAMRVLSRMPKWLPGKQNGAAVRVKYIVPVIFKLD